MFYKCSVNYFNRYQLFLIVLVILKKYFLNKNYSFWGRLEIKRIDSKIYFTVRIT